jgi:hypothetical protein
MKSIFLPALLAAVILMPCVIHAGTLENADLDDYRYQIAIDGIGLSTGVIYSQSTAYDICDTGCQIRLLNTGQTITMNPDDRIVIDGGVMKCKED